MICPLQGALSVGLELTENWIPVLFQTMISLVQLTIKLVILCKIPLYGWALTEQYPIPNF